MTDLAKTWTEEDFEELSWHDNYVHGLSFREGQYGTGFLELDFDYILEWMCSIEPGQSQFRIAPARLTFREVSCLQIQLDYTGGAAMGPFSIHQIHRSREDRGRYVATLWRIEISWPPNGGIRFEASGFEQRLVGEEHVVDRQHLLGSERY